MITTSVTATAVKMPIFRPGKPGSRRGTTIETTRLKTTRTRAATPMMTSLRLTGAYDNPSMRRAGILVVAGGALLVAVGLTLGHVGEEPGALTNWQALVLGIVQGATELLPISSSGHLILVPWLFDWDYLKKNDEFNQTFDVALHVGTLVAVVSYFWEDVKRLIGAWLGSVRRRRIETPDERIAWFVAVATVPAALIGALGESFIADHLGEPWQIAIFLAVFGVLLWFADRTPPRRQDERPGARHGLRRRLRPDPRPHARRVALGDHHHRGALPRARPRLGGPDLLPPAHPDRVRGVALQGSDRRPAR